MPEPAISSPAGAEGRPPGDAEQPPGQRRLPADGAGLLVKGNERSLEHVLGRGLVSEDLPTGGQDKRAMPTDERLERDRVTPVEEVGQEFRVGPLAEAGGLGRHPHHPNGRSRAH
jgi:hypothetical protein